MNCIISNSEQTLLIELERLRTQTAGQDKEIEHLKKIISLLEGQKVTKKGKKNRLVLQTLYILKKSK